MTSDISQAVSLLLAVIGAYYKKTTKTDENGDTIYKYGLPVLTKTGLLLVSLLLASSTLSIYISHRDADAAKAKEKLLQNKLDTVDSKVTSEQKKNLERSKEVLGKIESMGENTFERIDKSSSQLNRGISTATVELQNNVKSANKLLRKNISSRLFEVNQFRIVLFFDKIENPMFDNLTWEESKALSNVFCAGQHAKDEIFSIQLGSVPALELIIETKKTNEGCNPTVWLQERVNFNRVQIGGFRVKANKDRLVFDGTVSRYHLSLLKLNNQLNMDTFIFSKGEMVYGVNLYEKAHKEEVVNYINAHFPKRIGIYIEPDNKIEDMPSVGWQFDFGWVNVSENGDSLIYNYKKGSSFELWEKDQFLGI